MPGMLCAVAVCKNSLIKTKRNEETTDISYHSFPKDDLIRQQWILNCKREGKWNPGTSTVCSVHFTSDSFKRNLKAELLNIPAKNKLKSTAVPTLYLTPLVDKSEQNVQCHNRRTKLYKPRENKKTVSCLT